MTRKLFNTVFKRGRRLHSPLFTVISHKIDKKETKPIFSVVVSSKIAKKAVQRNKIKRLVRGVVYEMKDKMNNDEFFIILCKKDIKNASRQEIKENFSLLASKAGIISKQ